MTSKTLAQKHLGMLMRAVQPEPDADWTVWLLDTDSTTTTFWLIRGLSYKAQLAFQVYDIAQVTDSTGAVILLPFYVKSVDRLVYNLSIDNGFEYSRPWDRRRDFTEGEQIERRRCSVQLADRITILGKLLGIPKSDPQEAEEFVDMPLQKVDRATKGSNNV